MPYGGDVETMDDLQLPMELRNGIPGDAVRVAALASRWKVGDGALRKLLARTPEIPRWMFRGALWVRPHDMLPYVQAQQVQIGEP